MNKQRIDKTAIVFWVSLIGGVASILGLVISLASPGEWQSKHIAVSSAAYIFFLIGIELYILLERGRIVSARDSALRELSKVRAYRENYESIHAISHAFRDRFSVRFASDKQKVDFAPEDSAFCLSVLDSFRDIFQKLTNTRCATCIKAYVPSHDVMVTIARDSISSAERGLVDQARVSRLSDNTAWLRIVRDGEKTFFSNNLLLLAETEEYKNERPNWQHCYLSTIVWPIRMFDTKTNTSHLFGVLCVDTKISDAFDHDPCIQLGAAIADMIYPYFSRINVESIWSQFGFDAVRLEQGTAPNDRPAKPETMIGGVTLHPPGNHHKI